MGSRVATHADEASGNIAQL